MVVTEGETPVGTLPPMKPDEQRRRRQQRARLSPASLTSISPARATESVSKTHRAPTRALFVNCFGGSSDCGRDCRRKAQISECKAART